MNLSKDMNKRLVTEIRNAVKQMAATKNATEKAYYFSAVHGMANRIMNLEFDPELVFVHFVMNGTHVALLQALVQSSQGQSMTTLPPKLFDGLQDALSLLADSIESGERTYSILERIANLAYSTSGNGYYMFLKGMLKV